MACTYQAYLQKLSVKNISSPKIIPILIYVASMQLVVRIDMSISN